MISYIIYIIWYLVSRYLNARICYSKYKLAPESHPVNADKKDWQAFTTMPLIPLLGDIWCIVFFLVQSCFYFADFGTVIFKYFERKGY